MEFRKKSLEKSLEEYLQSSLKNLFQKCSRNSRSNCRKKSCRNLSQNFLKKKKTLGEFLGNSFVPEKLLAKFLEKSLKRNFSTNFCKNRQKIIWKNSGRISWMKFYRNLNTVQGLMKKFLQKFRTSVFCATQIFQRTSFQRNF